MTIFLDANILFSASNPKWFTHQFVELLLLKTECLTNLYAVEEASRNLAKHAPKHLPRLERLVKLLKLVPKASVELHIKLAEKDRPILRGAIAGRSTHLLTGDLKDFGALLGKTVQGVKIVTPKMLAEELAKAGIL